MRLYVQVTQCLLSSAEACESLIVVQQTGKRKVTLCDTLNEESNETLLETAISLKTFQNSLGNKEGLCLRSN